MGPEDIKRLLEGSLKFDSCMALYVDDDAKCVTLLLDSQVSAYHEWIKGERADVGLLRSPTTQEVVGIVLPLKNDKLSVWHDGKILVNQGFVRESNPPHGD